MDDIVEAVRLSSCGANRQAVRLVVVNKPEAVAKVQPLVKWAAYLPPEQGTPKADELPTLYVAVVQDTSIPGDLATDTGIALANMTLAAWDKGVGSCIMGAINKPALTALLGIEEPQKLAEGLDVLTASAKLNAQIAKVSGVVPQVAVVLGVCGGTSALSAANADVCIMAEGAELFFTARPAISF